MHLIVYTIQLFICFLDSVCKHLCGTWIFCDLVESMFLIYYSTSQVALHNCYVTNQFKTRGLKTVAWLLITWGKCCPWFSQAFSCMFCCDWAIRDGLLCLFEHRCWQLGSTGTSPCGLSSCRMTDEFHSIKMTESSCSHSCLHCFHKQNWSLPHQDGQTCDAVIASSLRSTVPWSASVSNRVTTFPNPHPRHLVMAIWV